jgi:hypothetical protein
MPDGGSEVDEVKDDLDSVVVGDIEVRVEADLVRHLIAACEHVEIDKDTRGSGGSWGDLGNVKNLTCSIDGPLCVPVPSHVQVSLSVVASREACVKDFSPEFLSYSPLLSFPSCHFHRLSRRVTGVFFLRCLRTALSERSD